MTREARERDASWRARAAVGAALVALVALVLWWPSAPPTPGLPGARDAGEGEVASRPETLPASALDASAVTVHDAQPDLGVQRVASAPGQDEGLVVQGAWGSEPGAFGRQLANESNPEGPMALAVGADGRLLVVDQVNRRVQTFVGGRFEGALTLPTAAAQDVAPRAGGGVVVLDRLVEGAVRVHDASGALVASVPVVGGPITEGGAVTGVFSDDTGIYVEREHQEVVRIADASGREDPARPTLWGRPGRDGRQLLRAALVDRVSGVVQVSVASRENGAMDWSTRASVEAFVLGIVLLDTDASGRVYLGVSAARMVPGEPPTFEDEAVVVLRFNDAGTQDGVLRLPALPGEAEVFRPLAVDDQGAVFMLVPGREGLSVRRWTFPP